MERDADDDRPAAARSADRTRTEMAAERTWLAWWRTALAATAAALAVGRFAPRLLHTRAWPYVALGCAYAVLAVGLLLAGARRQHGLTRALDHGEQAPLPFGFVAVFTIAGVLLALASVVLIVAQS